MSPTNCRASGRSAPLREAAKWGGESKARLVFVYGARWRCRRRRWERRRESYRQAGIEIVVARRQPKSLSVFVLAVDAHPASSCAPENGPSFSRYIGMRLRRALDVGGRDNLSRPFARPAATRGKSVAWPLTSLHRHGASADASCADSMTQRTTEHVKLLLAISERILTLAASFFVSAASTTHGILQMRIVSRRARSIDKCAPTPGGGIIMAPEVTMPAWRSARWPIRADAVKCRKRNDLSAWRPTLLPHHRARRHLRHEATSRLCGVNPKLMKAK